LKGKENIPKLIGIINHCDLAEGPEHSVIGPHCLAVTMFARRSMSS